MPHREEEADARNRRQEAVIRVRQRSQRHVSDVTPASEAAPCPFCHLESSPATAVGCLTLIIYRQSLIFLNFMVQVLEAPYIKWLF